MQEAPLHKGCGWPPRPPACFGGALLILDTRSTGARETEANTQYQGLLPPAAQVTFGHDLVHGDREEEDGVAVVGARAGTEVLLHGLHNGEELVRQHGDIVEDDLQQGTRKPQE